MNIARLPSAALGIALSLAASVQAQWTAVGTGTNKYVYSLAVYADELYAAGTFTQAEGKPALRIARWNGTTWNSVGGGLTASNSNFGVYAMTVHKDELYAAGELDSADGAAINRIAKWNGTKWSPVGNPGVSSIHSLGVYKNELYAGGGQGLAKLTDTGWVKLSVTGDVLTMAVYKDELYLGGVTKIGATDIRKLAKWDSVEFKEVAGGVFDTMKVGTVVINMAKVEAMKVYDGKLYVGGGFGTAGNVAVDNIAAWDGTAWSALGAGLNANVAGLEVFDGKLVVVGSFWKAEDLSANRVATWDGSKWAAMGSDFGSGGHCIAVYKNHVYSGGTLTYSGQNYISKWPTPAAATTALKTDGLPAKAGRGVALAAPGNGPAILFLDARASSLPGGFDTQGRFRAIPALP